MAAQLSARTAIEFDAATISDNAVGGSDTFVFRPDSNQDTIGDFEQGKDLIDVSGYGSMRSATF